MGNSVNTKAPQNLVDWALGGFNQTQFSQMFNKALKQPIKPSNGAVQLYEKTVGQYTSGIQEYISPAIISSLCAAGFHDLANMCEKGAKRAAAQRKLDGHNPNSVGAQYGRLAADKYPWLVGIMAAATPAGRALLIKLLQNEKFVKASTTLVKVDAVWNGGSAVVNVAQGKKRDAAGNLLQAGVDMAGVGALKLQAIKNIASMETRFGFLRGIPFIKSLPSGTSKIAVTSVQRRAFLDAVLDSFKVSGMSSTDIAYADSFLTPLIRQNLSKPQIYHVAIDKFRAAYEMSKSKNITLQSAHQIILSR